MSAPEEFKKSSKLQRTPPQLQPQTTRITRATATVSNPELIQLNNRGIVEQQRTNAPSTSSIQCFSNLASNAKSITERTANNRRRAHDTNRQRTQTTEPVVSIQRLNNSVIAQHLGIDSPNAAEQSQAIQNIIDNILHQDEQENQNQRNNQDNQDVEEIQNRQNEQNLEENQNQRDNEDNQDVEEIQNQQNEQIQDRQNQEENQGDENIEPRPQPEEVNQRIMAEITLAQALAGVRKYDGRPAFLQHYLNTAQRYHDRLINEDKPVFVSSLLLDLEGRAARLITQADGIQTFQQFRTLLEEKIPERVNLQTAFAAIQQVRQQPNEKPMEYVTRFEEALQELIKTGAGREIMETAKNIFVQNMNEGENRAVARSNIRAEMQEFLEIMKEQIGIMEPAAVEKCKYCEAKTHKSENCEMAKLFKVAKNIQIETEKINRNLNNEFKQVKCFKCNKMGHYASSCTSRTTNNTGFRQDGIRTNSNEPPRNGNPRTNQTETSRFNNNRNYNNNNNNREQRINRNYNRDNNSEGRNFERNQSYGRPSNDYRNSNRNNNRNNDTRRSNNNTSPAARDNGGRPNRDRINITTENTEQEYEIEGVPFFPEGDEVFDLN